MKASILAIGTELTTGQVTNRNAAWLSEKLVNLGIDIVLHETVADDRLMMGSALDRCHALNYWIALVDTRPKSRSKAGASGCTNQRAEV